MRIGSVSVILFILIVHSAISQPYGNEWIDHSQSYYKFPVSQEGVYRIDRTTLIASGVPIGSIDPRNLQVFARGSEQAIYVQGESDGSFDSGDFIEFYADGNDGFLDIELYDDPMLTVNFGDLEKMGASDLTYFKFLFKISKFFVS